MSSRKQREILRKRRIEFDRRVEENRKAKELENMTKQELVAYAYEAGVEIDRYAKKGDILEAIKRVE